MLFMAWHNSAEVIVTWNPRTRRSVVLLDGQLAARTRPATARGRVSKGIAAENLDFFWLEGAIREMLNGALSLREAMSGKGQEHDALGRADRTTPHPSALPDQSPQLDLWTPENASSEAGRRLLGALCPLCGRAMILTVPSGNPGALLCPLCARANYANASTLLGLIRSKMQEALDVAGGGLAAKARPVLAGGFDELKCLQGVLGELGQGGADDRR